MQPILNPPSTQPLNWRIVAFVGVLLLLIGYPTWLYLDHLISGGITQRGGYLEVDLKAMSDFSFDQIRGTTDDVPDKWRALDGKRVLLIGEMWTGQTATPELADFDLVYSISKCCVTSQPLIQHFVQSHAPAKKVPYFPGLVKVTGILHVKVIPGNGRVVSVYQLDVQSVQPYE